MPWVIELLSPPPNGSNREFMVSHVPEHGSEILVLQSQPMQRTSQFPIGGRYRRVGLKVTTGLVPRVGEHLWMRYFWISGEEGGFDPDIFDPDVFDTGAP